MLHNKKNRVRFVVTGMPRSGTVFMSRLLTSVGIMCGHESVFTPNGIDQALSIIDGRRRAVNSNVAHENLFSEAKQVAEASYMAAPFIGHKCLQNSRIIHIVRNPLKVISSLHFNVNLWHDRPQAPYVNFIRQHIDLDNIEDDIERTVAYYVRWNQLITNQLLHRPHLRLQVENATDGRLFDFLGCSPTRWYTDTKANTWGPRLADLSIAQIPSGDIKSKFLEMIEEFGYGDKM